MQLEDQIAKEFADIIKQHVASIDARLKTVEAREPENNDVPTDVVDEIAKAVALLAESPPLQQASSHPVVVNFSPPNPGKKIKTITTRRDEAGNLVARVIED